MHETKTREKNDMGHNHLDEKKIAVSLYGSQCAYELFIK